MVSLADGVAWGLLLGAALGYAGIALRIKRHEEFPGRPSFLATGFTTALFLAVFTVMLILTRLNMRPVLQALLLVLTFAAAMTVPLVWVRFALQYTGQRFPTGRRTFIRLGIPIVFTLLVIAGSLVFGFLAFGFGLIEPSERTFALLGAVNNYSVALTFFYLAALLVVGASLIAWTSYSFTHLSNKGGVLIGVGFILPWFGIVMPEVANLLVDQLLIRTYHAAAGAILGLGSVWLAISRYDLFGSVPAAGTVGRDVTVEEMNDPVLVTDGAGRVIDLNPGTERAFDTSIDEIGTPLRGIFDDAIELDELLAESTGAVEVTQDGRTFESTASELRDEYGRLLGHSFVFHDVTDRIRREQRIQVLNRVLRHNLRNDLNAVNGYAELIEEKPTESLEYAVQIQELATNLIAIGEKAREVEEIVAKQREHRTAPLSETVNQAVEETRSSNAACSIQIESSQDDPPVPAPMLTSVLRELLGNACQHNDAAQPLVELRTTVDYDREYPIHIDVADNGPGIPEHELTPILEGAETALEHGSGLGLWLIEWGVTALGGRIKFADNDPRGTVATVRLRPAS